MPAIKNFTGIKKTLFLLVICAVINFNCFAQRTVANFDKGWHFNLGDAPNASQTKYNDAGWRMLDLPHDWSIEGKFSEDNPATYDGGALPGGIGWYRKTFTVPAASKDKRVYIDFDGVYQKSTVWINGHELGFRPNGYISFRYELTSYLNFGGKNTIAVKVDNSSQPNSRWYSGSGIYRNVWLETTNKIAIDHWGTYVTTPRVSNTSATVHIEVKLNAPVTKLKLETKIFDQKGSIVKTISSTIDSISKQDVTLTNPQLWSVERPYIYKIVNRVFKGDKLVDEYSTSFGIRYFNFDADKGFSLNGKPLKILGVCDHHDLGSLGSALNTRALQRQLQMLKAMGCNAIRTSHNPPAPELLDFTDKMGFIVMDEAFDCWVTEKVKYDYHLYFNEWHKRDLEDQILRDRNHPSVIIWSIGNEIPDQGSPIALKLAPELAAIVHSLDKTRPITTANNNPDTTNKIIKSGAIDLVGYNYAQNDFPKFHDRYPGKKFIGTETTSALETRGYYEMPSDSERIWPDKWAEFKHPGNQVSAYDDTRVPWGSTHETTWKIIKKYDFLSGFFIWTGFDYLGEPTPYRWPSRSSYFGIIDLAGFPKDSYYMYQSEWTDKPVLHIFPHWNWKPGQAVDIWAYCNKADEVELYLNGKSVGIKKKSGDDLHVMWRVKFETGTLKAISRKDGKVVLTQEIHTAGKPAKIELIADRKTINADGKDLSFITVKILDKDGNVVPNADNLVNFKVNGNAFIAGVDNGDATSHDSFKVNYRKAFNGLALAILQAKEKPGDITFTATADGLPSTSVVIKAK